MSFTFLNKSSLILIFSFLIHLNSVGQTSSSAITQKGHYFGKNLFIQNIEISTNIFSVNEIYVNEILISDPIDSKIIEIDFSKMNIIKEDPVTVIIHYNSSKSPKIINPEVLIKKQDSTIQTSTLNKEIEKTDNKEPIDFNETRYKYYYNYQTFRSSSKNKFRIKNPKKPSVNFNRGKLKIKFRY